MIAGSKVVFQTGKLYVLDMAIDHLKQRQIPHNTREESIAGLVTAMPASPTGGPGVFWSIFVPPEWEDEARMALMELPFDGEKTPDVWDFAGNKRIEQFLWWIFLGVLIFGVFFSIYRWLAD